MQPINQPSEQVSKTQFVVDAAKILQSIADFYGRPDLTAQDIIDAQAADLTAHIPGGR